MLLILALIILFAVFVLVDKKRPGFINKWWPFIALSLVGLEFVLLKNTFINLVSFNDLWHLGPTFYYFSGLILSTSAVIKFTNDNYISDRLMVLITILTVGVFISSSFIVALILIELITLIETLYLHKSAKHRDVFANTYYSLISLPLLMLLVLFLSLDYSMVRQFGVVPSTIFLVWVLLKALLPMHSNNTTSATKVDLLKIFKLGSLIYVLNLFYGEQLSDFGKSNFELLCYLAIIPGILFAARMLGAKTRIEFAGLTQLVYFFVSSASIIFISYADGLRLVQDFFLITILLMILVSISELRLIQHTIGVKLLALVSVLGISILPFGRTHYLFVTFRELIVEKGAIMQNTLMVLLVIIMTTAILKITISEVIVNKTHYHARRPKELLLIGGALFVLIILIMNQQLLNAVIGQY